MSKQRGFSVDVRALEAATEVSLRGVLDELAASTMEDAFRGLRGRIRINLRGVERVNSFGLGILMKVLDVVSRGNTIEYAECPPVVVDQFQMLDFSRYGRIVSFVSEYYCPRCKRIEPSLLTVNQDVRWSESSQQILTKKVACDCGGTMIVDESLDFLIEHLKP